MIELCYQDTIDDYLVPNGTPPLILKKMKEKKLATGTSPKISYSGLAKNGSKWLPEIIDIIHHDLDADQRNLKVSFQTHAKNTLKVINRANINNDKLVPLIDNFKSFIIKNKFTPV